MESEQDKKAREEYVAAEKALLALEAKKKELLEPIRQELSEAEDRFEYARECLPDFIAKCEDCDKPLFDGDLGYAYMDYEVVLCADHAPTYGENLDELESVPEEEWDAHYGHFEEGIGKKNHALLKLKPRDERHVWKL